MHKNLVKFKKQFFVAQPSKTVARGFSLRDGFLREVWRRDCEKTPLYQAMLKKRAKEIEENTSNKGARKWYIFRCAIFQFCRISAVQSRKVA